MSILLYDLCGQDTSLRFSPYCWRTKMALAHKGLSFETAPVPFTEIKTAVDGEHNTLPIIKDGDTIVSDSFLIAEYLDKTYPDKPALFPNSINNGETRFIESWTLSVVHKAIAGLIVKDIHDALAPDDQAYFRQSREAMFNKTLEEVQSGRYGRIDEFRAALTPIRMTLKRQEWIGGNAPTFGDFIVYGALKWASQIGTVKLLEDDDSVADWFSRLEARYPQSQV